MGIRGPAESGKRLTCGINSIDSLAVGWQSAHDPAQGWGRTTHMAMTYRGTRIHDALNQRTSWNVCDAVASFGPGAKPEEQHP